MDPWTPHAEPLGRVSPALLSQNLTGLRIGYLSRAAATKVSADVTRGVKASLDVFSGLGAEIEEVNADIDWMSDDQRVLYLCSIANNLGQVVDRFGAETDPILRAYVTAGKKYDIAAYIKAVAARTRLFRAVQGLFETYDFLVSPTITRTALAADFNGATGLVEIDGEAVGPTQPALTAFVYPFNLTGHPALAVPSGWAADGLPTSVQIIGPRHADSGVLRLGGLLEQTRPWADRRPALALR
jgi:aspartyl-tRNA(Asn)/glutamyl-tRNA(Gln) amidotransferase subunit A